MNKSLLTSVFILASIITLHAQSTSKRVLFLGNSYTYFNDLPVLFQNFSLASGDSVYVDSNTPGGYTLEQHTTNATSSSKMAQGNWDFMVLQEQSQRPSFPDNQVQAEVFPYAKQLVDGFQLSSPCGQTVFYMTWGRENGDASNCATWPPICTYEGMDSLLALRYRQMATENEALVSPVGASWRYIRDNHPGIQLYNADGSHPSLAGTYLAACCFYTVIHRKDPALVPFDHTLSATEAQTLRNAASVVVFDSLAKWNVGKYDPVADFSFSVTDSVVTFTNPSTFSTSYRWDFGDGDTTSTQNPTHTYTQSGTYNVQLIASKCGKADTLSKEVVIVISTAIDQPWPVSAHLYPNPAKDILMLEHCATQSIHITDLSGKQLDIPTQQSTCTWKMDIQGLPKGLYLLHMNEGEMTYWKKWIKE